MVFDFAFVVVRVFVIDLEFACIYVHLTFATFLIKLFFNHNIYYASIQ